MMTAPRDTIVANDSILDAFRHSSDFDYSSELVPNHQVSYFDRFWEYLKSLLDVKSPDIDIPAAGWWGLCGLVLLLLAFFIWKNRVGLFSPKDVGLKVQEEITEDDINEVDFDQLIAEAEHSGDHLALCRLRYLQTLKAASDASLVDWRRYKTPTQYAMEWPDEDFGIMTNHFLRIRYGHYNADAALAEEMRSRQHVVQARIATEQAARQQEGGEKS